MAGQAVHRPGPPCALLQGLVRLTVDSSINEQAASDRRAAVLSMSSLVLSAELAFFEPVIGFITNDVSIQAAFAFVPIFLALVMPGLYLLWRRAHGARPGPGLNQASASRRASQASATPRLPPSRNADSCMKICGWSW
ncbi:MAG TPA: hypothetical protein PKD75_09980 [Tepidiformaceae bacterium]|nr:hypothetical protein [Tepidiformaceae bacterium]